MRVLGIESSCDETAASVVEDGSKMLSNVIASSVDLHKAYGGVVPEIAARSHLEVITPVIQEALDQADCSWEDIDAIGVTYGPGLGGSLLIGVLTARTLAINFAKPLYAINHTHAHIYANFITSIGSGSTPYKQSLQSVKPSLRDASLEAASLSRSSSSTASSGSHFRLASHQSPNDVKKWKLGDQIYKLPSAPPALPLMALVVSGGHTQLVYLKNHKEYQVLGRTQDDAVGEAFDKVAKILGLPYPGGPSVAMAARTGDAHFIDLPKAKMTNAFDFSFSGLKTAVLRASQNLAGKDYTFPSKSLPSVLSDVQKRNIAASFQRIAAETLVDTLSRAIDKYNPASVVIGGGVAANDELRRQISRDIATPVSYTDIKLCTDNAAMIATLTYYISFFTTPVDPYKLEINPSLGM